MEFLKETGFLLLFRFFLGLFLYFSLVFGKLKFLFKFSSIHLLLRLLFFFLPQEIKQPAILGLNRATLFTILGLILMALVFLSHTYQNHNMNLIKKRSKSQQSN
ncbi:hypothetical protein OIU79_017013 [Salix purpurea]|uniref:Uncharacterized protein n=1 Tax=Salix purpurea TaxID=77065 RepID=A0A9Q0WUT5_SALPP|nr:hypothetical protein OIU79_017013 [Salix purpurea]